MKSAFHQSASFIIQGAQLEITDICLVVFIRGNYNFQA